MHCNVRLVFEMEKKIRNSWTQSELINLINDEFRKQIPIPKVNVYTSWCLTNYMIASYNFNKM